MSMWAIPGQFRYNAGAAGTVTLPQGAQIIQIHAHATSAGTVVIFGGDSIPIPAGAGWGWQVQHLNWVSHAAGNPVANSQTIVFTGTDAYFVEWREGAT